MQDLSRHLKEAIAINTERLPPYASLSDGASIPFSKKMIRYEKLSLWGAWYFDWIGDYYQERGIPYMKSEFIEMSLTPDFSPYYPPDIDFTKPLKPINIQPFSKTLKTLIRQKDYEKMVDVCHQVLHDLAEQPHVYCMLRHIVESFRRIAYLIPFHEANCQKLQIKAPTGYSIFLLKTHRWVLGQSKKMDEAIAPIQLAGVPILFQDLPHIDLEVEGLGDF